MSVTRPEQKERLGPPGRRGGRIAMAVSTSALMAGSAAAIVLLDSPGPASTATVPASAGLTMVPDLPPAPKPAPAPGPVPAVAAPITDLGPPAAAVRDDSRTDRDEGSSGSRATETSDVDEEGGSSAPEAGNAHSVSTPSAREVDDDTDTDAAESAARDRMRERVRDRVEDRMRSEVRDWMQGHGHGSSSDGPGRSGR